MDFQCRTNLEDYSLVRVAVALRTAVSIVCWLHSLREIGVGRWISRDLSMRGNLHRAVKIADAGGAS